MIPLILQAAALRDELVAHDLRIVLAESCTSGNVAASLGCLPGVSSRLCGSFVVYRNASKTQWLGIGSDVLSDPTRGAVCMEVTEQLSLAALAHTDEASLALAVTGHLGPAPDQPNLDGLVFCALAMRSTGLYASLSTKLVNPSPTDSSDVQRRVARLQEATEWVLQRACHELRRLPR